jgi:formate transporter
MDLIGETDSIDALLPPAIARKAENLGVTKTNLPLPQLVALAMLAGAFISFGAMFSTVVTADASMSPGLARLLGGFTFSLGLVLVVVGGAELFTGNTLIVMAWASRRVSLTALLRNWGIVFVGNFVGALFTALLVARSGRLDGDQGSVGIRAVSIAEAKVGLPFDEAIISGVLANTLVCLAVWMSLSARSVVDRVVAVVLPVAAFVAAGFEHSIANMYFIPVAMFHRRWTDDVASLPADEHVDWGSFLFDNLLPVTIGNIIGGGALVAGVYWFVYLRPAGRA